MQNHLADIKNHPGAAAPGVANEQLVAQLNALRSETDYLRQQLRQQPPAAPHLTSHVDADVKDIMSKMLGEARQKAAEITQNAQKDADQIIHNARQRVDELRVERERICAQLQEISHSLRNTLKDSDDSVAPAQALEQNYLQDDFDLQSLKQDDFIANYIQTG